jgi:hypothetical protein
MAKTTMVSLIRLADGKAMEFEVGHAENILKMKDSGWQLPKDSEYEYKDGTIVPRDKGKGK